MELMRGAPADMTGRADTERRTYELLDGLGVEYWRAGHPYEPAASMEICARVAEA